LFTHAIARKPGSNFSQGLTTSTDGPPDYQKALAQHAEYCEALKAAGLSLTVLDPDPDHPDSTFVEDVAVLARETAVITRPGAKSRRGETLGIQEPLRRFFRSIEEIRAPGTLDGGDVCQAGRHFFIGVSRRTNENGARQLASILGRLGCSASLIDICPLKSILHLKSGLAAIGDQDLLVVDELLQQEALAPYNRIRVAPGEAYAANCIRVNDKVLIPAGFCGVEASVRKLGYHPIILDVSEFRKMDGGLSCLSLRF
jgi:dimethylargininase